MLSEKLFVYQICSKVFQPVFEDNVICSAKLFSPKYCWHYLCYLLSGSVSSMKFLM